MMKKFLYIAFLFFISACSGDGSQEGSSSDVVNQKSDNVDHIYATISTNKGNILLDLAYNHAPMTVANFIVLAEGLEKTIHSEKGVPFYDGLTFHRVMPQFMIQGGDPMGTGSGGPGYSFKDEFTNLKHDRPGTLSMANSGPNTNGSQFLITHVPTPWLDGDHTVFGYVIEGQEVVNLIAKGDVIEHIGITRVGASAEDFDAMMVFRKSTE